MSDNKIYIAGPWITEHEVQTVNDAMLDWYKQPYKYVELFETEIAKYHNRKYALMTPNCTTSIHLLLAGLGIGPGDEVIIPECTWIASAAPISYVGATPVFCDIDPDTWCLSPASVKKNITPKTKAIIAVDLFGNMPSMNELLEISVESGVPLIEDAAEALGSVYHGIKAGKFGIGSVFSFHRTKTITTGEGGMLLLDDDKLYEKCKMWRDHGRGPNTKMYFNDAVTFKYMPFNIQAALGYAQFQRLDELVNKKRWMYYSYKEQLQSVPDLQFNAEPPGVVNGVWITGLVLGKRYGIDKETMIQKMAALDVPVRPFFYPLSSLPAYKEFNGKFIDKNPVAYDISKRGINLPCAFSLNDEQLVRITSAIKKVLL